MKLNKTLLAVFFVSFSAASASQPQETLEVKLSSPQISEGQVALLDVSLGNKKLKAEQILINFMGKALPVFSTKTQNHHWYAILSVPVGTPTGELIADVAVVDGDHKISRSASITVAPSPYGTEILKVDPTKVKLSEKDEERSQKESIETAAIYASPASEKFWNSAVMLPIGSRITSPFGSKRLFNGALQSFHSGDDLRAMPGTPVKSAANGIVRLAKNLFFAGNCVIVDHGMGFFTSYAHLSKFRAKVGEKLKQGQVLGLSGATGRVSGPHLHWGARVNEVVVSPVQLRREFQKVWR